MKQFSLILVLALLTMGSVLAQTITGVVVDESGEAVIGANVYVEGNESEGTVSDFDGSFELTTSSSDGVLIISYTGSVTRRFPIASISGPLNVTMREESELIDEVVIIGNKVAKKETIASTPTIVDSRDIEMVPMATFDNVIQGRAAGVQIFGGTGQPGVSAGKVLIRGTGSINASNDPLYVMDGVIIDGGLLSNINPNDIANIQVLKDATQTSIYGARAANGVILITTKKGKYDAPTRFNYNTQFGWAGRTQEKFDMMDSPDKLEFERYVGELGVAVAQNRPGFIYGSPLSPSEDQGIYDSLSLVNTDWADDVFFRTGTTQQHELSASGGSAKTRFFASGSYLKQEGQTLRSDLERVNSRVNLEHKATDKFSFGVNLMGGYSRRNFIESENSVSLSNPFASAYLNNSYETPLKPDGTYNFNTANSVNVLELTENSSNVVDELKTIGRVYGTYNILENLSLTTDWGIDFTSQTSERWIDPDSRRGQSQQGQQGAFSESYFRNTEYTGTTSINFNDYFLEDKLRVDVLLANQLAQLKFRSFNYTGFGVNPKLPQTPAGITPGDANNGFIAAVGGGKTENTLASFISRVELGWDERYNFTASLRRDGSSKFGANNRWANFWAVGGSWVISEESFMANIPNSPYVKLFANYGTSGNEALAAFQTLSRFGFGTYGTNQTLVLSDVGSPDLKWEESQQASVGVEFEMLKDRALTGSVTLYNNTTTDLFILQTLPPSSAGELGSLDVNAGKMRNRGVEVQLDYNVINKNGFLWNVYGNYAYNDNEILDLGQVDEFEAGTSIVREGLPIDSHFEVAWAGVDPATGQALYYDINGNVTPVYDAANRVTTHGTINPPHIGGFGSRVSYKGVEVSAFFNFAAGHRLFNNQTFFQENHNFALYNQKTIMNDIWKQPGDITEVQGVINPVTGGISRREFSGKDIEDADFLRFRNLTVAYNLPMGWTNGTVKSVRIFGQAQNLITWTPFTGFDPEISNNIAQYEYPAARTFTVGLQVGL